MPKLEEIEQKITEALKDLDDTEIFEIADNITMDDEENEYLNDYDRGDLISVIAGWVTDGIKRKSWTLESWIKDTLEEIEDSEDFFFAKVTKDHLGLKKGDQVDIFSEGDLRKVSVDSTSVRSKFIASYDLRDPKEKELYQSRYSPAK